MGMVANGNNAIQFQRAWFERPDVVVGFVADINGPARGVHGQTSEKNWTLAFSGLAGFFQRGLAIHIRKYIDFAPVAATHIKPFPVWTERKAVERFLERNELPFAAIIQA